MDSKVVHPSIYLKMTAGIVTNTTQPAKMNRMVEMTRILVWLTCFFRKTFSTLAMLFPKMVPSWSPIPANKKPKSGIPKMAYKIQKILPPSVLGAIFPYLS